jgi:hypothetical protein
MKCGFADFFRFCFAFVLLALVGGFAFCLALPAVFDVAEQGDVGIRIYVHEIVISIPGCHG